MLIQILLNSKSLIMSVIILLLVASITVAIIFLVAFIWSVKSGQYADHEGASIRMLFDEIKGNQI